MHDIHNLMDILGYDQAHKVRERLDAFKAVLGESLKRGLKNKVLVDNNGLAILRRAKELEERGHTLKDVTVLLAEELKNPMQNNLNHAPETDLTSVTTLLLLEKDKRLKQMEEEILFLRGQVTGLEEILQQRLVALPPPKGDLEAERKLSRWKLLKQLVGRT